MNGLEKYIGRFLNKNKKGISASIILLFILTINTNAGIISVNNATNSGVGYGHIYISHEQGATEGDDGNYDALYLESPNPLHIYSHNSYSGLDYMVDARGPDSTTTYDVHLIMAGWPPYFEGRIDNFLQFRLYNYHDNINYHWNNSNFEWKNIFLGDFNDSNNIIADIKYVINNGSIYPSGTRYGNFPLPDIEGYKAGVYDKRKVFFFNHADFNRDRRVDGKDFAIWANNFGRENPNTLGSNVGKDPNDLDAYADIDRSGRVDYNDLSLFSGEWLWDANDPNTWSRVR